LSSLLIEVKKELERPLRVCEKCLDLVVLLGYATSAFIIPRPIFKSVAKCDICGVKDADFVIVPIRRGIPICGYCLDGLISVSPKHKWHSWQKKEAKNMKCVLCDRPAKYIIIPPKTLLKK